MDDVVRWFLVKFDRWEGSTLVEQYDEQDVAFRRYIAVEKSPDTKGHDPRFEVVLIGAESLDAVRAAYPHYFAEGSRDERLNRVFAALAI